MHFFAPDFRTQKPLHFQPAGFRAKILQTGAPVETGKE